MNARIMLPISIFLAGICAIVASVAAGQARVSLFIIFPVFTGSSWLFVLGTLLVILSFIVGFLMLAFGTAEMAAGRVELPLREDFPTRQEQQEAGYGGVIFIGPVPIAFGSTRTMALAMLLIGLAAFLVLLALVLLLS